MLPGIPMEQPTSQTGNRMILKTHLFNILLALINFAVFRVYDGFKIDKGFVKCLRI